MEDKNDIVLLFPKLKTSLKKEAAENYRNKNYKKALELYDQLIKYNETEHEILFGKLLCLVELKQFELAQKLCEDQLRKENKYYFDYLHLYVTLLFQTEQYHLLISQLSSELKNISLPPHLYEQFKYFYDLSTELLESQLSFEKDKAQEYLKEAVEEKDLARQYQLINNFMKNNIAAPEEILDLLTMGNIHPVIKTNIFFWLQKTAVNKKVRIKKFNKTITINPYHTELLENNKSLNAAKKNIYVNYDDDPILMEMLVQMIYRFFYVLYPMIPGKEDLSAIIKAMEMIVRHNLYHLPMEEVDSKTSEMVQTINKFEALYLSVVE